MKVVRNSICLEFLTLCIFTYHYTVVRVQNVDCTFQRFQILFHSTYNTFTAHPNKTKCIKKKEMGVYELNHECASTS